MEMFPGLLKQRSLRGILERALRLGEEPTEGLRGLPPGLGIPFPQGQEVVVPLNRAIEGQPVQVVGQDDPAAGLSHGADGPCGTQGHEGHHSQGDPGIDLQPCPNLHGCLPRASRLRQKMDE